ncbi:phage late control D family protein [Nonomuraea sp. NPDC002799]
MARFPSYAPDFRVEIDGGPLPAALRGCVSRISHTDGLQGADRVEVTVANPDLRWLDHPLLQVDQPFTLSLGYAPDPLELVFTGEITGVTATFPNGGMPTLTVVAHDFLQRLTIGTKDRGFMVNVPAIGHFPLPDPLVTSLVSAENLLIPLPDPVGAALSFLTAAIAYAASPTEARRGVRLQQEESDFGFLSQIAKDNGWEMYIDHTLEPRGRVLRFQFLIQDYAPSAALVWGRSLTDFTPRLSTVGQVAGVAARVWLPSVKAEIVVVLSWDYDRSAFDLRIFPGLDGLESLLGEKKARKVLTTSAVGPATMPKKLLSELLPRLNGRLTGSGSAVGDLAIKAGRVIDLRGLGKEFSGLYRVTSATHTIDGGGFRTAFEVRKEVWFEPVPTPSGLAGLARVNGQRIG